MVVTAKETRKNSGCHRSHSRENVILQGRISPKEDMFNGNDDKNAVG
jgi:hypothetical protein